MGPKIKTGLFVVCERPETAGERFLAKVAQYTPGDPHCYTIEYIIEKNNRVKRGNNEFVVEVDKLIVLPKDFFASTGTGSKPIVRVVKDISNFLNPIVPEPTPSEPTMPITSREKRGGSDAKAKDAKRKRKKTERIKEESESSESEWEEYYSDLWESGEAEATSAAEAAVAPTSQPASAAPSAPALVPAATLSGGRSATNRQKPVLLSSSTPASREEPKVAIKATDLPKPQRKQRIPREAKRDNDLKKSDLRPEVVQFSHISGGSTSSGSRNHLPGVISCPNKRWKAVVEMRGKLIPVPGLFDSDIEAAVARDEFLMRKGNSAAVAQTTFRIDLSGPLFYGHGVLDPAPPGSLSTGGREGGSSSRKKDRLQSPQETAEGSSLTSQSLSQAPKWWWDQVTLEHFLKDSPQATPS